MKSKFGAAIVEAIVGVVLVGAIIGGLIPRVDDTDVAAKVAQVQTDMRSIGIALEAYKVDSQRYPLDQAYFFPGSAPSSSSTLMVLTKPVAYLAELPIDQFLTSGSVTNHSYSYKTEDWLKMVTMFSPQRFSVDSYDQ